MKFRLATADDAVQLAEMRWEFRSEDDEEKPIQSKAAFTKRHTDFFREGNESGRWVWWVAEEDGQLAAMMSINVITSVPKPSRLADRWGYLTNVYTRPKWRNAGVGTELMNHVLGWAKGKDLEEIIVSPSDRSRPFYGRAGFGPDDDFLLLRLRDTDATCRRGRDPWRRCRGHGREHRASSLRFGIVRRSGRVENRERPRCGIRSRIRGSR